MEHRSTDTQTVTKDVIRNNFKEVAEMEPVKTITSDVLEQYDGKLLERIESYFNDLGNVSFNNNYGKFTFYNTSAKNVIFHNFNELKGYSLGAFKEVLENGNALYYEKNYKGKGKDRMFIAAPIKIASSKYSGEYMMGVAVEVSPSSNRVHLIEVVLEKGEPTNGFDSKLSPSVKNDSPSTIRLLQQVIDVKNGKLSLDDVTAVGIDSEKFSLEPSTDSKGRELTPQQQEYFKDVAPQLRDGEGRLKLFYHGTPQGGFTVFKNDLQFFTEDKEYAENYQSPSASSRGYGKQETNPQTYEVYLNIKKPFDIRDAKTKELFVNEYVKEGWALGINPYEEFKDTTNTGLPSWEEADNIYEWLEETDRLDDYDGIIVDEGGIPQEDGSVKSRGIAFVEYDRAKMEYRSTKKGDWLVTDDGRRKKLSANTTVSWDYLDEQIKTNDTPYIFTKENFENFVKDMRSYDIDGTGLNHWFIRETSKQGDFIYGYEPSAFRGELEQLDKTIKYNYDTNIQAKTMFLMDRGIKVNADINIVGNKLHGILTIGDRKSDFSTGQEVNNTLKDSVSEKDFNGWIKSKLTKHGGKIENAADSSDIRFSLEGNPKDKDTISVKDRDGIAYDVSKSDVIDALNGRRIAQDEKSKALIGLANGFRSAYNEQYTSKVNPFDVGKTNIFDYDDYSVSVIAYDFDNFKVVSIKEIDSISEGEFKDDVKRTKTTDIDKIERTWSAGAELESNVSRNRRRGSSLNGITVSGRQSESDKTGDSGSNLESDVNEKFSIESPSTDSKGRTLTPQQQEYFGIR